MCLDRLYSDKEKKAFLAKLPNEFIVWKLMNKRGVRDYVAVVFSTIFKAGLNITRTKRNLYPSYALGYHSFFKRAPALRWRKNVEVYRTVPVKIKKRWVRFIGTQHLGDHRPVVIVTNRIICPDYISK